MVANTNSAKISFDAIAASDDTHVKNFKIYVADYALLSVFAALFFVVFLQFFTRYVLNDSISWTEEAARYLLIILSFAGAARCQVIGSHIVLEFLDRYFGRALPIIQVFALVCTLFLFALFIWSAWELIERTSFQKMVSLPFPKYYLYAVLIVLAGVNALIIGGQIYSRVNDLIRR